MDGMHTNSNQPLLNNYYKLFKTIKMKNIQTLTNEELLMINGGGFWGDVAYALGYASHAVYANWPDHVHVGSWADK